MIAWGFGSCNNSKRGLWTNLAIRDHLSPTWRPSELPSTFVVSWSHLSASWWQGLGKEGETNSGSNMFFTQICNGAPKQNPNTLVMYRSLISQWSDYSDLWQHSEGIKDATIMVFRPDPYRPVPARCEKNWWHTHWQTWKNIHILIPRCIDHGPNCMWLACLCWELIGFLLMCILLQTWMKGRVHRKPPISAGVQVPFRGNICVPGGVVLRNCPET